MTDETLHRAQDSVYGTELAAEMRKAPGLARIRAAVAQSACAVLDQPVWKRTELGPLLDLLTVEGPTQRVYLDVPIAAVVALTHRNFSSAVTWRGMLQDLHGFGWDERVIDYCESEIGHQSFPAPEAAYELKLTAYGGAVKCTNGVHRLVAAVNWLGATQGEHAVLRKVSVRYGRSMLPSSVFCGRCSSKVHACASAKPAITPAITACGSSKQPPRARSVTSTSRPGVAP